MRGCELKGLRRKNVDLFEQVIKIERESTKTNAGVRLIPLNRDAVGSLRVPCLREWKLQPNKSMVSWRSAWRSLTQAASLKGLRFHDLKHQAITELFKKGLSDQTIMEVAGHVSKFMF